MKTEKTPFHFSIPACLLCLLLTLVACEARFGNKKDDVKEEKAEAVEEAVPVEVATIRTGEIESILKMTATLIAEEDVKVLAKAGNELVALKVEEGDRVEVGQILARLDNRSQKLQVEKSKAALAKAQRELKRQENLFNRKMTTEQSYNDAKTEVEQQQISLDEALLQLEYTEIKAPITGTITMRAVNLGDEISVGKELFQIVNFDSIVARIYVPEKYLPQLKVGLMCRIDSPVFGEQAFSGRIRRIAPAVDDKTGTVKVTVGMTDIGPLRKGMYVNVNLVLDVAESAVLVPKKALVYDNDQTYVYRLGDDSRVQRVELTPLLKNRDYVQPAAGIQVGDRVVVAGQAGLKNKALVNIVESEADEAPAAE
ncbi:efflux RND transporter periplasmic adaptor subunit [Acanthopleuribacter pedis]|uniref:Efflux RND transporter periplasmic adaptor subunit n=1 Tax=Acanthopleuribacter pedis TaxID=442870 RepID=A0A8J7Q063_9BACT|nr:efflux RND transporter periplasmic adaptor subunit [Acanthopleuribacter pedis]MBO1317977.1 efflux RND transporter periplasmic adaptor subunit [Acanthopleuribacter pedis]